MKPKQNVCRFGIEGNHLKGEQFSSGLNSQDSLQDGLLDFQAWVVLGAGSFASLRTGCHVTCCDP